MSRLIASELLKLRKRGMTWILLYILIGIMILIHVLTYAFSQRAFPGAPADHTTGLQQILGLPLALPLALLFLASLGAVLATIMTASTTGNEYNWGTIRIALISAESRLRFLTAKLISVAIVVLIGMLIGLATGFLMSLITTALSGNGFDFSFATRSYFWDQFLQFWRTFYVIVFYSLMGFVFAIIGRSAMPGIAVSIGILFLEPLITTLMRAAGGWVSNVPDYLFSANVNAINALTSVPGMFGGGGGGGGFGGAAVALPSVQHAYVVLGVYILVFLAAGYYLFRKRDVTG